MKKGNYRQSARGDGNVGTCAAACFSVTVGGS